MEDTRTALFDSSEAVYFWVDGSPLYSFIYVVLEIFYNKNGILKRKKKQNNYTYPQSISLLYHPLYFFIVPPSVVLYYW